MRVACPECAAEYDLPPALTARLGGGRTVRCARCGTAWAPASPLVETPSVVTPPAATLAEAGPAAAAAGEPLSPPDPVAAAPAAPRAPEPLPEPPRTAPAAAAPRPPRAAGAAWAASILLLAGAAAAAWHWRVAVVEAWPPAARAFVALGLAG